LTCGGGTIPPQTKNKTGSRQQGICNAKKEKIPSQQQQLKGSNWYYGGRTKNQAFHHSNTNLKRLY
jgi:hypothetical protein